MSLHTKQAQHERAEVSDGFFEFALTILLRYPSPPHASASLFSPN